MRETISGLVVFVLPCTSAALGMFVRPRLPEQHRSRETTELMQVTIDLQVTFAALVFGLLTASVKQRYDHAAQDRQNYALELTMLDQCLRDYGPGTEAARANIHSYTAAVIASTWPSEPPPAGVNFVSKIVIILCAISLSSVMFVIVDLAEPYGGYSSISSKTMRTALDALLTPTP